MAVAQYGLKEKVSGPAPSHIRPEPPIQIPDSQVSFWDHIDSELSMQMLDSNEAVLLVGGANLRDEDPPRGLLLHAGYNLVARSPRCRNFG